MKAEQFHDLYIADKALEEHGVILRRYPDGLETNVPHFCVHHSPSGFEWGYGGSGPADLALNICEYVLMKLGHKGAQLEECFDGQCFTMSWQIHQDLKWRLISTVPREGGVIPWDWLCEKIIELCTKKAKRCHICSSAMINRIFESKGREIWQCAECKKEWCLDEQ